MNATTDVAYLFVAGLLWLGAVYKLVRAPRSTIGVRPAYALVACLALLAAAVTLQIRFFENGLNDLLAGHATLLVGEILALSALCAYQVLMVILNDPHTSGLRRVRTRITILATATAVMTVFYVASSSPTYPGEQPPRDDPFGAAQMVIFLAYAIIGSLDVAQLAFRFVRLGSDRNLLRLALYLMGTHAGVSILYASTKLVFLILLDVYGVGVLPLQHAFTNPMIMTSAVLVVVAATLPSWGHRIGMDRAAAWFGRYMSFLAVYPLWRVVATPGAITERRSRWADRLIPTDIDFRLTQRLIEIRDGLLLLDSAHREAATRIATTLADQRGLAGVERAATVEAATIAVALTTRQPGNRPVTDPVVASTIDPTDTSTPTPPVSIADEVAWLARIAEALTHSPVVRATRERVHRSGEPAFAR